MDGGKNPNAYWRAADLVVGLRGRLRCAVQPRRFGPAHGSRDGRWASSRIDSSVIAAGAEHTVQILAVPNVCATRQLPPSEFGTPSQSTSRGVNIGVESEMFYGRVGPNMMSRMADSGTTSVLFVSLSTNVISLIVRDVVTYRSRSGSPLRRGFTIASRFRPG